MVIQNTAAAALAVAKETPNIALAPKFRLSFSSVKSDHSLIYSNLVSSIHTD